MSNYLQTNGHPQYNGQNNASNNNGQLPSQQAVPAYSTLGTYQSLGGGTSMSNNSAPNHAQHSNVAQSSQQSYVYAQLGNAQGGGGGVAPRNNHHMANSGIGTSSYSSLSNTTSSNAGGYHQMSWGGQQHQSQQYQYRPPPPPPSQYYNQSSSQQYQTQSQQLQQVPLPPPPRAPPPISSHIPNVSYLPKSTIQSASSDVNSYSSIASNTAQGYARVAIPPPPPPPPVTQTNGGDSNRAPPPPPRHLSPGPNHDDQSKKRGRDGNGEGSEQKQSRWQTPALEWKEKGVDWKNCLPSGEESATGVDWKEKDVDWKNCFPLGKGTESKNTTQVSAATESVDANLSAINALSALEFQWTAPTNKPAQKKNSRRSRRRKRKAEREQSFTRNGSAKNPPAIHDATSSEWVTVDHDDEKMKKSKAGIVLKMKGAEPPRNEQLQQHEVIDLTTETDFPPLSAGGYTGTNSDDMALHDMSTSQLTSYAAALARTIDSGQPLSTEICTNASTLKRQDSSEMDISEGEEEEGEAITTQPPNLNDLSTIVATTPTQSSTIDEKEMRRLKLAELKAKAKLASVRLKFAQKKALVNNNAADAKVSSSVDPASRKPAAANILQRSKGLTTTTPNKLPDITALRMVSSLVIENVNLTGTPVEVRFVDSLYGDDEDDSSSDDEENNVSEEDARIAAETGEVSVEEEPKPDCEEAKPAAVDDSRKKSEALTQQLHLAKLRLELAQAKKKKSMVSTNEAAKEPLPKADDAAKSIGSFSSKLALSSDTNSSKPTLQQLKERKQLLLARMQRLSEGATATAANDTNGELATCSTEDANPTIDLTTAEQKQSKLEELKRRQRKLKQQNKVSNLRNLIHRQRDLLHAQGNELTETSNQLQSCAAEIKSKQSLLEKSEQRLEEMHHRKRIIESMVLRATDKLMVARKQLNERKTQEATAK
eukprot:scaffold886_cov177-Alexandrium_tamarense.AAC.1